MKRLQVLVFVSSAAILAAGPALADSAPDSGRRTRVVSRPAISSQNQPVRANPSPATAASYSVQVNIVTRIQGTSFFRTAIDISNNTSTDGVIATFQYCYTFSGVFQGCTAAQSLSLHNFDSFHTDDTIQYLATTYPGILVPGADQLSFGTFIVTFDNLPSNNGWEGTVTARTYSPFDQANPSLGTVAIAYPGSLFFESASGTLVGIVRDTRLAPTDAGALRTNLGITNTALVDATTPVSVELSFYDVTPGSATNGHLVGTFVLPHALSAGEVFQVSDVFNKAAIPVNVDSCIVFADIISPTTGSPTIEGYIDILDGGTQDGAYFEMKCSVGCTTF